MAKAKTKRKAQRAKAATKSKSGARAKTKSKAAKSKAKKSARPAKRAKPRPKHKFSVSHHRDADFDQGLRTYARYRDLGIAPATGGMVHAQVIRFTSPFQPEEVSAPHYHDADFQMVYVLKGWYRAEFEGEGEHTFEAGSCWIQPSGIKHTVLGYSDDCELLEIALPADFETVTLAES